ncbi:AIG2 (avirulence induced protein) family protein [Spatholobus suberectus]|nr:AIG2 (avirulence induced protein) family protein [Spatholobus suberectus]
MVMERGTEKAKPHLIFAYDTLKQGFPNHTLMAGVNEQRRCHFAWHLLHPIVLPVAKKGGGRVEVEAYLGHKSFGEVLWKMKREVGLSKYEEEVRKSVKEEDWPSGRNTILDLIS